MFRYLSFLPVLVVAVLLSACAPKPEIDDAAKDLGDFRLGFNVVVAKNAKPVPPTRNATAEEWEPLIKAEMARRFGGYEGDRLYHIGIGVDAYALAVPGIPILLAPKSVMAVTVNIWDDAAGKKLNEEPKKITVLEEFSGGTIVGTGYTKTREEQMASLTKTVVRAVETWLVENNAWFKRPPPEVPYVPAKKEAPAAAPVN